MWQSCRAKSCTIMQLSAAWLESLVQSYSKQNVEALVVLTCDVITGSCIVRVHVCGSIVSWLLHMLIFLWFSLKGSGKALFY